MQLEYSKSEVNRKLALPSFEFLNNRFKDGMKIENYERLRQRYEARPPFNFYLNPDLEVITKVGYNYVETGFYDKTSEVRWLFILKIINHTSFFKYL